MRKLSYNDIYSINQYREIRHEFRLRAMAHKNNRRLMLGDAVMILFEDRLLMQYQIQEMLKIENITEPARIEEELAAYNPLIPDGGNWKATMMLQYTDAKECRQQLAHLGGIEDKVWMQVAGLARVYAIANEDLNDSPGNRAFAVHFLRFELDPNMIAAVKSGAAISAGISHPGYRVKADPLAENLRKALLADLA